MFVVLTDVSPATTLSRLSGPRIALDGDGNLWQTRSDFAAAALLLIRG
jgi:hypothetical protein